MKCPYRTKVIHAPEYTSASYITHYAKDITEFNDCLKEECPFYYAEKSQTRKITEHCRRVEREAGNDS